MPKLLPKLKNRNSILISFTSLISIIVLVGLLGAAALDQIIFVSNQGKDELIPAIETAEIAEKLYQNRLFVEEHITQASELKYQKIEKNIQKNNLDIDSLILRYSEVYNLKDQRLNLLKYRNLIIKYRNLEQQVLKLSKQKDKSQAQVLFLGQGVNTFQTLIEPIHQITERHTYEGELKYEEAQRLAYKVKIWFYLAIGIAFLVVLIVGTIASYSYINE